MAENSTPGRSSHYVMGGTEGYKDERFIAIAAEVWSLEINPKDLQQMKPEVIQKIYYHFLVDVGVDMEDLNAIPPHMISHVQNNDLTPAIRLIGLTSNMKKYLKMIYNDESFRLADAFNIKPKRTRRFLAMIYDFLVSTEHYIEELETKEEEIGADVEAKEKYLATIEKLKQRGHERRAENARSQVLKEQEATRLEEKRQKFQKCQERKMILRSCLDEQNQNLAEFNTSMNDTELRMLEAREKKHKLEGLVIKPGEREAIQEMEENLESLKENNRRVEDHLVQLQRSIKSSTVFKDRVGKLVTPLHEIEQQNFQNKDLKTSTNQRTSEVSEVHDRIKDKEDKILQVRQNLTSAETNYQKMRHTWELKQKSLDVEIKDQKQVLEGLNQNQTEEDIVSKDMEDTIAVTEEEIKQSKDKLKGINITIKDNYNNLIDMAEEGNMELRKTIEAFAEALEDFKKLQ